jgi:hypothetical protein
MRKSLHLKCWHGRILANGYPTGVEVCDPMGHGGPCPVSTNFGTTSVGTLSVRRFLRLVCCQFMSQALRLPICGRRGRLPEKNDLSPDNSLRRRMKIETKVHWEELE